LEISLSLSLYDASVPVYLHMLRNLESFLDKAEAHAKAQGSDLSTYVEARVAPDMHPLNRQIQFASDAAKGGAARLAGVTAPSFEDTETSFPELRARIAMTIAYVGSITPAQMEGDDNRTIELKFPNGAMTFTARDFLLQFSLPNFMFHVVTTYNLLRGQGVPLGKMDFLMVRPA
jgi:hypothetical protein